MLFSPDTNCILPLTFDPAGKVARFIDDGIAHRHGIVVVPRVHGEAFNSVPSNHLGKAANSLFHMIREAAPADKATALAVVNAFRAKYADPFHPEGPWGRRVGDHALAGLQADRVAPAPGSLLPWVRRLPGLVLPDVVNELKKPCAARMWLCEFDAAERQLVRDRNLALTPFFDAKSEDDRAILAEVSVLAERAGQPVLLLCGDKRFRKSATEAIKALKIKNVPPPVHAGPNVCPDFTHGPCIPPFGPPSRPQVRPLQ